LKLAGVEPQLQTNNGVVQARLHSGPGGNYLWVTNPARTTATVAISVGAHGPKFQSATDLWEGRELTAAGNRITITLPARDGAVIALR
jgi:hypothetical protein